MSDQILARYGRLDRDLATVVRTSIHSVLIIVVLRLEEAHRKLVELSRDGVDVDLPDNAPSDRLLILMVELFGVEHTELLDTDLDPVRTRVANLTIDDEPTAKRTVIDLFASVSMFLVAEANMLYQCADDLPPDRGKELFEFIESVAAGALAQALSLNREVEDEASLHDLLERAAGYPGDEAGPQAEEGTGICIDLSTGPFASIDPAVWQGDSPDREFDDSGLSASTDEDEEAVWEQLQQIYYCGEMSCGDPHCPLPTVLAEPECGARTARPELSSGESPPLPARGPAGRSRWRRSLRQVGTWISTALTCALSVGFAASFVVGDAPPWVLLWAVPMACLTFGSLALELAGYWTVFHSLSVIHRSHRAVAADRRSIP
ncbi:hypothetical protein ACFC06_00895 [Nocardia sp. NPDC056064]|uniref:hypothetical protein n=1 Tax=Nocardia sp. NPDC056064 TaxID=3345701 RepID=UPI0035E262CE